MPTIKLKFRSSLKANSEGTLYYQVIYQRQARHVATNYRIMSHEWSAKTDTFVISTTDSLRAQSLQLMVQQTGYEMQRAQSLMQRVLLAQPAATVDDLCLALKGMLPCPTVFDFLGAAVEQKRQQQRLGTWRTYLNTYRSFKKFRCGADLTFNQLTPTVVESYEAWLTAQRLKQNTIRFYLRTLHTLCSKAQREGLIAGDVKTLFARIRLSFVATRKRAISESELCLIERLRLPTDSPLALARDLFMFSFYTRGMSFVDMAFLRKGDLRHGLLSYCRRKTNQPLYIEWTAVQQAIVSRYVHLTQNTPYLLPIILDCKKNEYAQYQRQLENVNRSLKHVGIMVGLKQPLTTYVARHTWASIAQSMNISIAVISAGMGHQSCRTTQVYLSHIETSCVNEANQRIIQRITGGK